MNKLIFTTIPIIPACAGGKDSVHPEKSPQCSETAPEKSGIPVCAIEEDGKIVEIRIRHPESSSLKGNIYVGQVEKTDRSQGAAFVRIRADLRGYLPLKGEEHFISANGQMTASANQLSLRPGDSVLVQVVRDPMKGKLTRLTGRLSLPGRFLVLVCNGQGLSVSAKLPAEVRQDLSRRMKNLLPEAIPYGLILRTNAENSSDQELLEEYCELDALYHRIALEGRCRVPGSILYTSPSEEQMILRDIRWTGLEEIRTDEADLQEHLYRYADGQGSDGSVLPPIRFYADRLLSLASLKQLRSVLDGILREKCWLPGGGFLVIQQTEAFVCIDVNTGKTMTGRTADRPSAGKTKNSLLQTNLEAAREIAFQLRLRNLSGIILVDFINMDRKEEQELLLDTLRTCVSKDPVPCRVIDLTPLGIVEMTREKTRPSVAEELQGYILQKEA